jgi:hypothetical protein
MLSEYCKTSLKSEKQRGKHIAIAVPSEGATNEWLEEVTNEEYNKL